MDDQAKRLVCRMVAGLIASDNEFNDSERAFLSKVLQQFGVPENEWDAIFPLLDHGEAEEAIRGLDEISQKEVFEMLLEAAIADDEIVEEERDYLRVIGETINITQEELTERLGG